MIPEENNIKLIKNRNTICLFSITRLELNEPRNFLLCVSLDGTCCHQIKSYSMVFIYYTKLSCIKERYGFHKFNQNNKNCNKIKFISFRLI